VPKRIEVVERRLEGLDAGGRDVELQRVQRAARGNCPKSLDGVLARAGRAVRRGEERRNGADIDLRGLELARGATTRENGSKIGGRERPFRQRNHRQLQVSLD
jgi:hypothetical protein